MAKKKEEVNLNEIDASFVISSFKNKERRNNPSSIPRALVPEHEKKQEQEAESVEPEKRKLFRKNPPVRKPNGNAVNLLITKACLFRKSALRHVPENLFTYAKTTMKRL